VATAIKTARELALLPYVVRTATDKGPGRGGRGGGRGRDQAPRVAASAETEGGSGAEAAEPAAAEVPSEPEVTGPDVDAELPQDA
jgi:hypothetical protein